MKIKPIINKYLEDRESLTEQEFEFLLQGIRKNPAILKHIKDQILLDELISREISSDRKYFSDQVYIRIQAEEDAHAFHDKLEKRISRHRVVKEEEKERTKPLPGVIKLPWYARVRYVAMLTVGVLIATYFINEYQYSQTEDLIRLRLKEFYGKVEVERSREVIPAQKNMELRNNDRIRTDENASAVMEYTSEATRVEISKDTDVRIREDKGQKLFDLDNGRVDLSVDKQPRGAGLRVTTPHAHVDVVGTIFSVDVSKKYDTKTKPGGKGKPSDSEISDLKSEIPRTRVETYEGKVQVTRKADSRTVMLAAGHYLVVTHSVDKKLAAAEISGWDGIRRGPDGEILRRYRWTFENGIPDDFILTYQTDCKNNQLVARQGLCVILPVERRTVPVVVTGNIRQYSPLEGCRSYGACFKKILTRDKPHYISTPVSVYDSGNLSIPKRFFLHKVIVLGKHVFCLTDSRMNAFMEYEHAKKRIGIFYQNIRVKSIELEEKAISEIPQKYRSSDGISRVKKRMRLQRGASDTILQPYNNK